MGPQERPQNSQPPRRDQSDPHQVDRMWQHGLHLDTMLFQRGNLFLVAESLLLVAYAGILGIGQDSPHGADRAIQAARVITTFGLLLTLIWAYVGHRHLRYYSLQSALIRDHLPEYRQLREQWNMRGVSSLPLVTYALPLLSAVMWVLLLLITWS